jgi:AcrR family transcriptional regulator
MEDPVDTPTSTGRAPRDVNSVRGPQNVRERVLAAAQELFLTEGPKAVSMRKVAAKAGVTAPAIYRHYEDKDELLNEIINAGLEILQRYLEPAFRAQTPFERLQLLIDYYLDFALEQPRYFDFAFLAPSHGIRLADELARYNRSTFLFAVQQVHLCMEQGVFVRDDPLETSIMVWAEAHGLVTLFRMERFGADAAEFRAVFRRTIDRMLQGLRPR